jgi:hypothetical protein
VRRLSPKVTLALVAVAAAATATVPAISASGGDTAPLTRARTTDLVVRAIEAEKDALQALTRGNPNAAERALRRSMRALERAEAAARRLGLPRVAAQLRQAINKDESALDELDDRRRTGRARAQINRAIVAKDAAAETLTPGYSNKPPVIESFVADLRPPRTIYRVSATDPEKGRAAVAYDWSKTHVSCGTFAQQAVNPTAAVWSHPNDDPFTPELDPGTCPHGESSVHPGTVVVVVSDEFWNCTITYETSADSGGLIHPNAPCVRKTP